MQVRVIREQIVEVDETVTLPQMQASLPAFFKPVRNGVKVTYRRHRGCVIATYHKPRNEVVPFLYDKKQNRFFALTTCESKHDATLLLNSTLQLGYHKRINNHANEEEG